MFHSCITKAVSVSGKTLLLTMEYWCLVASHHSICRLYMSTCIQNLLRYGRPFQRWWLVASDNQESHEVFVVHNT